jgi:hypothetical protein
MPTLQPENRTFIDSKIFRFDWRKNQQKKNNTRAASQNAISGRQCETCQIPVGKSKQYCEPCRKARSKKERTDEIRERDRIKSRERRGSTKKIKHTNGQVNHFKRDEAGLILEKFCTCCETWKTKDQYRIRKDTPSGLQSWCKGCIKDHQANKESQRKIYSSAVKYCSSCGISYGGSKRYCDPCGQLKRNERSLVELNKSRIKNQSIHVINECLCRRCNLVKPINDFFDGNKEARPKIKPRVCVDCYTKKAIIDKKEYRKKQRKNPIWKIKKNLRRRLSDMIKTKGINPDQSKSKYIGCSSNYFKKHLSSMFTKKMNWDNYGSYWHVDHILPVSSFDHTNEQEIKKCWHWSNLRPLEAQENMNKSDSIVDCQPELLLHL